MEVDAFLQTYTFIESIKGKVFDEGDSVYLYIVHLGSELDRLGFLPTHDGAYIVAVYTDNTVTDILPAGKQLLLLLECLPYD